jgi:hypothetical protein
MLSLSGGRSNLCDTAESVPRPPTQPRRERYSALMRHTKHIHLLLASVLFVSGAAAQTGDSQVADSASREDSISAARSRYTQTADSSPDTNNTTLAQLPRGGPGRPFPPQRGYPRRGSYQTPWMDHGNAAHALIGAAIGFGIGAAIGVDKSTRNGTPVGAGVMIGGGLFGLIGGAIGSGIGGFPGGRYAFGHRRRAYPQSSPEDEEEAAVHSQSQEGRPSRRAPASLGPPSHPATAEVSETPPSSGRLAVP